MFAKAGGRHGRLRAKCRRRVSGDRVFWNFTGPPKGDHFARRLRASYSGGYFLVGSFRPSWSWLDTQSSEAIAEASEISPASTVPATISANLYTLPMP